MARRTGGVLGEVRVLGPAPYKAIEDCDAVTQSSGTFSKRAEDLGLNEGSATGHAGMRAMEAANPDLDGYVSLDSGNTIVPRADSRRTRGVFNPGQIIMGNGRATGPNGEEGEVVVGECPLPPNGDVIIMTAGRRKATASKALEVPAVSEVEGGSGKNVKRNPKKVLVAAKRAANFNKAQLGQQVSEDLDDATAAIARLEAELAGLDPDEEAAKLDLMEKPRMVQQMPAAPPSRMEECMEKMMQMMSMQMMMAQGQMPPPALPAPAIPAPIVAPPLPPPVIVPPARVQISALTPQVSGTVRVEIIGPAFGTVSLEALSAKVEGPYVVVVFPEGSLNRFLPPSNVENPTTIRCAGDEWQVYCLNLGFAVAIPGGGSVFVQAFPLA